MGSTDKDDDTVHLALVSPNRAEEKTIDLTTKEITHRTSKLPCQKMKSRANLSSLDLEEICTLKDDGIGNNKHTQQVYNTAKKLHKFPAF